MEENKMDLDENIIEENILEENIVEENIVEEKNKISKKKKRFNNLMELAICFLIAAAVSYLIVHFVAQRTYVDGKSMYPTLNDGDNLIVEKLSYRFSDIERFDIVVFPHYNEKRGGEVNYIKRVIGLPGETIQIKEGVIYINGEKLEDEYGYYSNGQAMHGGDAEEEIYIGDDEYFVLGDNRNNSDDSRKIGCISEDIILGQAVFRIFPFSSIGSID